MAFSVAVELLNIRMRKRAVRPAELHERYARVNAGPARPAAAIEHCRLFLQRDRCLSSEIKSEDGWQANR